MNYTLLFLFFTFSVWANDLSSNNQHGLTPTQRLELDQHNQKILSLLKFPLEKNWTVQRPFAEFESAKYLIQVDDKHVEYQKISTTFIAHLPAHMHLVLLTNNQDRIEPLKTQHKKLDQEKRLHILVIKGSFGGAMWTRDHMPLPMHINQELTGFVGHQYINGRIKPNQTVNTYFSKAPFNEHQLRLEGGNFLADEKGNCFKTDLHNIPTEIFNQYYGCKKTFVLECEVGICHIDEALKVLPNGTLLTNVPSYLEILAKEGFHVISLPIPKTSYGTYANALIIEDQVFVPIYREETDEEALRIYRDLGYKTIPIDSRYVSSAWSGSLHCLSMVYPDIDLQMLESFLNGQL